MGEEISPILSKWGKPLEPGKVIGSGHDSDYLGNVRRLTLGKENKFLVEKPVVSKEEAQRAYQIYKDFKNAGLPVVGFLKIRIDEANKKYKLWMEDLNLNDTAELFEFIPGKIRDLLLEEDFPQLRKDAIRALAVIHNLGYCEFHPALSFFAVRDNSTYGLSLKILDYSNFTQSDVKGNIQDVYGDTVTLEYQQTNNLEILISALNPGKMTPQVDVDRTEYKKLRQDKIINF